MRGQVVQSKQLCPLIPATPHLSPPCASLPYALQPCPALCPVALLSSPPHCFRAPYCSLSPTPSLTPQPLPPAASFYLPLLLHQQPVPAPAWDMEYRAQPQPTPQQWCGTSTADTGPGWGYAPCSCLKWNKACQYWSKGKREEGSGKIRGEGRNGERGDGEGA